MAAKKKTEKPEKPKKPKKPKRAAGVPAGRPPKLSDFKAVADGAWRDGEWVSGHWGGADGEKWIKGPRQAKTTAVALVVEPRDFAPADLPDFDFTSPSSLLPRTAKAKRDHGCDTKLNKASKVVFTGKRDGIVDSYCKGNEKPCSEARKACPVQLVWVHGKPHLRFCKLVGQPGYLVPVDSAEQGYAMSKKACEKWGVWPDRFFDDNAPEVVERATKSLPNSKWGSPGLGESPFDVSEQPTFPPSFAKKAPTKAAPRGRKNDFSRAIWWLAGGTTAALVFGRYLNKTQPVK